MMPLLPLSKHSFGALTTGTLTLPFGAWTIFTAIAKAAGITVAVGRLPEAVPIWEAAFLYFLTSPFLQALVAGVFAIGWLGIVYLPRFVALHKLQNSDSLNRWSVSVDIQPGITGSNSPRGGCVLLDVVLTNVSTKFKRVLEFRMRYSPIGGGSEILLSTEHSREQPYRRALAKLEDKEDTFFPLKNPIEIEPNGHVEGRIEIDVPPHISTTWLEIGVYAHAMTASTFEVHDNVSGETITLTKGLGWDAVKNEPRQLRHLIRYAADI